MLLVNGFNFFDLWSMSLPPHGIPEWTRQPVSGPIPQWRYYQSAFYDSLRDRVVIYGGEAYPGRYNDAWALELGDPPHWTQLLPSGTPPPALSNPATVYDPVRDRLVVFGGQGALDSVFAGIWQLDFGASPHWSAMSTRGTHPGPRTQATAIYDPWLDIAVFHAGWFDSGDYDPFRRTYALDETWVLRLQDPLPMWLQADLPVHPRSRTGHVAVVDTDHRRMVVQGGTWWLWQDFTTADAWALRLTGVAGWDSLPTTGETPLSSTHAAIYSPERHSMFTYGGRLEAYPNSTFELNLDRNEWTLLGPADDPALPKRRGGSTLLVDPAGRQLEIFGGYAWGCQHDLWTVGLAGTTGWMRLNSSGTSPRCGAENFVFDSKRNRLIGLGGGYVPTRGGLLNEASAMSLNEPRVWTTLPMSGPVPPGRFGSALVYDARRDRLLMFGGISFQHASDDCGYCWDELWELSLGDSLRWKRLSTTNSPGKRGGCAAFIDTVRDQLVLCGGVLEFPMSLGCYPTAYKNVWTLALSDTSLTWNPHGPEAPYDGVWMLDTARDRLIDFNPLGSSACAISLQQPDAWRELGLTGLAPQQRDNVGLAFDHFGDRLLLFGGYANGAFTADINGLQFLPPIREVGVTVTSPSHRSSRSHDAPRSLVVTVHGDGAFSIDSLSRSSATLNGARVDFGPRRDGHDGRNEDESLACSGRNTLVGRVVVTQMSPVAEDAVLVFEGRTRGGMHVTGHARLGQVGRRAAGHGSPLAEAPVDPLSTPLRLRVAVAENTGGRIRLDYVLPATAPARIEMFDVQGRRITGEEVVPRSGHAGSIVVGDSRSLLPGLYLVRLRQADAMVTTRVLVIR